MFIFVIHIYKTVRMFLANQQARPTGYVRKKYAGRTEPQDFASSTMIASGLWLLLFVIVHVRQFEYGTEYRPGAAAICIAWKWRTSRIR